MNRREAKRIAHRIAYRFLQQALDGGGREASEIYQGTEADQRKIDKALDDITQRHFELADIPELHAVEIPLLADAFERFRAAQRLRAERDELAERLTLEKQRHNSRAESAIAERDALRLSLAGIRAEMERYVETGVAKWLIKTWVAKIAHLEQEHS